MRRKTSWLKSSASVAFPVNREHKLKTLRAFRRTSSSHEGPSPLRQSCTSWASGSNRCQPLNLHPLWASPYVTHSGAKMFPSEPPPPPLALRAREPAVARTPRGRHSESSLEAHPRNPAHCAPSYLDFRREHKRRETKRKGIHLGATSSYGTCSGQL